MNRGDYSERRRDVLSKAVRCFFLAFILLLAFSLSARAQEAITPEKRTLIKELLTLTQADRIGEVVANEMLSQIERDNAQMIDQAMANLKMSKEEKEKTIKEASERSAWMIKRFRELLPARVNFTEFLEKAAYPIYDKYFTADELRDLNAFYKTPTGQKSIKVMPGLVQESFQKANELLTPKILDLINEITKETNERFKKP
jgi:hypothetical protein